MNRLWYNLFVVFFKDRYLEETKAIDAERERQAKASIMEVRKQLKLVEDQREEAERRANAAEKKVY